MSAAKDGANGNRICRRSRMNFPVLWSRSSSERRRLRGMSTASDICPSEVPHSFRGLIGFRNYDFHKRNRNHNYHVRRLFPITRETSTANRAPWSCYFGWAKQLPGLFSAQKTGITLHPGPGARFTAAWSSARTGRLKISSWTVCKIAHRQHRSLPPWRGALKLTPPKVLSWAGHWLSTGMSFWR